MDQPVHSEGDQPWDFSGRNDAKGETPVLWPPYVKSWLIGKDSDAGRDWVQEEKGTTEDEMAGWHHWLDGREFEWTLRDGDGQGGLVCCDSWGRKESDTTEPLNWTELSFPLLRFVFLSFTQTQRICLQCRRPGFDPWVRKIPWRKKWQPTLVFLPGKSHRQRSLVGYSPWSHKELYTIERLHFTFKHITFIAHFISSIFTSAPPQIIRH